MHRFTLLLLILLPLLGNATQVFVPRANPSDFFDLQQTEQELDAFKNILSENEIEVIDSVSDQGALLLLKEGACLLKTVEGLEEFLEEHEIPILYRLRDNATADSSDFVWIDEATLAVGIGWHTNLAAFNQLEKVLDPLEIQLVPVFLPYGDKDAAPYLQSLFSLVDNQVVVLYPPLLPHAFVEYIENIGLKQIEVTEREFIHLAASVLNLGSDLCLMLEGCPEVQSKLEELGIQVLTYKGDRISRPVKKGPCSLVLRLFSS